MNIIILTTPFYPRKSGLGGYVLNLSKHLTAKGHKVRVLCYDTEKTNISEEIVEGIHVKRFKPKTLPGVYYTVPEEKIIQYVNSLKQTPDLIITNTRFFQSSLIGLKLSKQLQISLIHVEHGTSFVQTNNPVIWIGSRLYDFFFGKKILRRADKVICISNGSKEFVKKLSGRDAIVIPNGTELKNLPKYKPKKEIKNIIFVGRLIYAKGVQDLIVAFSELIKTNKNLTLTIVGDGPYRKELENLTKSLSLNSRVKFLGEKTREEVLNILSKGDLFVNPSYSEGLPTSVLEAGAVGLPVIATDVGGTREVIINNKNNTRSQNQNQTGLLIKEKSPIQIKEAIEFIISNQKSRKLHSNNLNKLIKKDYNWEEIIKKWEGILSH